MPFVHSKKVQYFLKGSTAVIAQSLCPAFRQIAAGKSNHRKAGQPNGTNTGATVFEAAHTLVAAGANQVNGPSFQMDDPDAALDEARTSALKRARARADLYARAAGLRVTRVLTISESRGYAPQPPVMFARAAMAADAGVCRMLVDLGRARGLR